MLELQFFGLHFLSNGYILKSETICLLVDTVYDYIAELGNVGQQRQQSWEMSGSSAARKFFTKFFPGSIFYFA